jgi:putative ABC transport system permease protein
MRRATKILRDVRAMRGRVLFMVLALAAGQTALGAVLWMRGVLQREMDRNYMGTIPASATFDIGGDGVTPALLEQVRARPEVAAAERRATLSARWRVDASADWGRALLFVFDSFADQSVTTVRHESGALVPEPGTVLVERSAMGVIGVRIGDTIEVSVAGGAPATLEIAGVVHDPALAPAATEQAGYFYAGPQTLGLLGRPPRLNELRVLVANAPLDQRAVEEQVEALGGWLAARDLRIHEVKVPPPGHHPHQAPSNGILLLLSVFAGLTLLLAAALAASLMATMMARQVREIAIMKTIGAAAGQIRWIYASMLGTIAVVALLVSAPATVVLSRAGIDSVARLLNFDIASHAVPFWVVAVQLGTGLGLPLLAAAPVILRAGRASVRQAADDHGARVPRRAGLDRLIGALDNRLLQAALRNALRVPRRLALTLGLLAVGGGLFISAMSVNDAWEEMTEQVFETRHYDVEVRLAEAADASVLQHSTHVEEVEAWGISPVTHTTPAGLPLSRTYPDGGHGSFSLVAVPDETQLIDFRQRSGRWLRPGDTDAVVLNQMAAARLAADPVGTRIDLAVEGRRATWEVVGVVDEVAAPANAYVNHRAFVARTGQSLRALRVATATSREPRATRAAIAGLQRELAASGRKVVAAVPLQLLFNAMAEHVVVLVRILLGLALLMAAVGVLALSSSMSASVVERTRELGVLKAIGARPAQVRRLILTEGLFVTLLSLPLAVLIGAPVAGAVGQVVGRLSFEMPLSLNLSWSAVAIWSAGVLMVSAVASLVPSIAATRRSVQEAISHT